MSSKRSWAALAAVLTLTAAIGLVAGSGAFGGAGSGWQAKVDPAVLKQAASGQTQFIIYLNRKADLSRAYELGPDAKGHFVYEELRATAAASQAPVIAELQRRGLPHRSFWVSNFVLTTGGPADVEAFASRSDVKRIYPVGRGGVTLPKEVAVSSRTRGPQAATAVGNNIAKVQADRAWNEKGINGNGAVVAGADTGVRWTHNALKSHYRGWDGATANHNYNWHDAIHNPNVADCAPSSPTPCDDDTLLGGGHGTHTMGTIVGDDGAENQIGMAPGAKWIACRNMSNGIGVVPTYMECMEWFLAPTRIDGTIPDPSKRPHVTNNSWGCVEGCPPPMLQDVLQASRASGIVYAVSAGNDGPICSTIYHPLARYPEAFTVGSTIIATDAISGFSSRGPVLGDPTAPAGLLKPNIVAPGSAVFSSLRATDSTYGSLSGTSMAGPHVAGLVALVVDALLETQPAKARDVEFIEGIIEQTTVELKTTQGCGGDTATEVPNNTFGWGRIDALAAVTLALAGPTSVHVARFGARRSAGGTVVTWRTAAESKTLGFNLFRNGKQLNRALIPAKHSGKAAGAAYRFVDRTARRGGSSSYRLQVVDLHGKRTWYAGRASVAR
ncbi:MAG: S8 family serine peptidase [Gaiellaceae bacterium]